MPLKAATYVIGLISLCCVIILIIILVVAMRGIPLKTPYTLVGLLAIILLITSIGLMVKDIINGFKYYKDNALVLSTILLLTL